MSEFQRPQLTLPNGADKLLLHSCCAPCSGEVMEAIQASGIDYTIFFYNPNIHPQKEYEIRKEENIRFAHKHGVPFIDADYDTDNWFARARGWNGNPSAACAARCALICASNAPRSMPTSTILALSAVRWEFHAGRTCSKSTTAASAPPGIIQAWSTGIITGVNRVDPRG